MSKPSDVSALPSHRRRSSHDSASSAALLGNWQLEQLAFDGSLTYVYYARPLGCPPAWPADYVVKVLKSQHADDDVAMQMLQCEAEVGRHSSHPNLVPILEARLDARPPHLVMPRLEGAALMQPSKGWADSWFLKPSGSHDRWRRQSGTCTRRVGSTATSNRPISSFRVKVMPP